MKRQLQGVALLLFSILLTLGFAVADIRYVFDLSLEWSIVWMLLGAVGLVMVFRKEKK